MSEPSLALQEALRNRLIGTAAVTALVPAANILDRNQRPAPSPSIILGEDQVVNPSVTLRRNLVRVYSTVHIWKREPGLTGVKAIGGAIEGAVRAGPLFEIDPPYGCTDSYVETFRVMRDPDGETSHGVIVINSLVTLP